MQKILPICLGKAARFLNIAYFYILCCKRRQFFSLYLQYT